MKHLCVFGCLLTEEGKKIKDEMLSWLLNDYYVMCVDQNPPGELFEYPAIKKVIDLCIEKNEPVLYIHTKGAGNPIPGYYIKMMDKNYNVPKTAMPEDCQKVIRNMWKNEFTGDRLEKYINEINVSEPTVCCPYTGKSKWTWWNAWMINTNAAKILNKTFHQDSYRWYYERLFSGIKEINVKGLRMNNLEVKTLDTNKDFWNDLWNFYNKD